MTARQQAGTAFCVLYAGVTVLIKNAGTLSGKKNFRQILHNKPELTAVRILHTKNFIQSR